MDIFKTTKVVPIVIRALSPVAEDVSKHFQELGFDTKAEDVPGRGYLVSLTKGGIFKAVVGMKTALNINMKTTSLGTHVEAGVGIFGLQTIPTAVTWFIFWPVMIPQIWTLVQQANLDDEAVSVVERCLAAHATQNTGVSTKRFCHGCGESLTGASNYCPHCGVQLVQ